MASTAAPSTLAKRLTQIARNWSPELVRNQTQFGTFLESLAKHPHLTAETVEAASALQNNVLRKKYQLSAKILKPASVPHHYERLVEATEKSAKGIGRPWWKAFFGIW